MTGPADYYRGRATFPVVRVPWRMRGHINAATYLHRMRLAAWAFGRNGMLPPSYTRRPGRNVWRHAYTRQRHFNLAAELLRTRYWIDDARVWLEAESAQSAARNADWGLTR